MILLRVIVGIRRKVELRRVLIKLVNIEPITDIPVTGFFDLAV